MIAAESSERRTDGVWRERLQDAWYLLDFPGRLANPNHGNVVGPRTISSRIEWDVGRLLTQWCGRHDVEVADALAASLGMWWIRSRSHESIVLQLKAAYGSGPDAEACPVKVGPAPGPLPIDAVRQLAAFHADTRLLRKSPAPSFDRLPVSLSVVEDIGSAAIPTDAAAVPAGSLQIALSVSGNRIVGGVAVRDGAVSQLAMDWMIEGWLALLKAMLTDDSLPVARLPLVGDREKAALIRRSAGPAVVVSDDDLVHTQFERQVRAAPDGIAVSSGTRFLTYAQLNARANRVAKRLLALGVRPDDRVAICVERSLELLVGVFGILKAGACYVPVDPAYPADRIAYMFRDSAPIAILAHSEIIDRLPESAAIRFALDAPEFHEGKPGEGDLDPGVPGLSASNLAYVIYTSGSTGQPKGAAIEHRGLINMLGWYVGDYDLDASERTLVVTSFSFDLTQKNLLAPLCCGGQVHLSGRQFDPDAIVAEIRDHSITTLNLTPSFFSALVESEARISDQHPLASLRRVFLGGEPIPVARFLHLEERYPQLEVINSYGPTECTDVVAAYRLKRPWSEYLSSAPPIGRPIQNTQLHVLDEQMQLLPDGATGEVWVGGLGVSRGYLDRAAMTSERFRPDTLSPGDRTGARLYKTGDLGRWGADGELDYLGRNDFQVKIRGFRIELGEIETALARCDAVGEAAVLAIDDAGGEKRLVAYVSPRDGATLSASALRAQLSKMLAEHMVPGSFVMMSAMPLTPSGKIDRKALPPPARERPTLAQPYQAPVSDTEKIVCEVFGEVLEVDPVGRHDNFFELGGTSLGVVRAADALTRRTGKMVSVPTVFANASARMLAQSMQSDGEAARATRRPNASMQAPEGARNRDREPIAVIAMAGRFPGASTVEGFWQNLLEGRDGITDFTLDTLDPGIPDELRLDPSYVRSRGIIDDVELFDNEFFGISSREAEVIDPQHRIFLEVAWECLERGGYPPDNIDDLVGVYAGVHAPTYLQRHILAHPEVIERIGEFQVLLGNDKDYAPLRVAHKLGLRGPAISITTTCSTSLVAIVQAVDHLRLGRCDMALAGGVAVTAPYRSGYLYQDGSMLSEDGRTRTFDARGTGTAFNDGAACVLLKRLPDALRDGDPIYAVIRGAAVNNDGGGKASFSAPSVDGQAAVIEAALEDAGIDARTVSYIEAHGTATPLGDPVEVEALTRAFRRWTPDVGFCRIGSAKSNVGHMVTAAGAAGLIKTAMSLRDEVLPATIHYESPNPKLHLETSPFVVNDSMTSWPRGEAPRRAGVSSFGVGGTNAHIVVEEAPERLASSPAAGMQLLQLSARSPAALEVMATQLADHLERDPRINLADVAHTLHVGRSRFAHRLAVSAASVADAAKALRDPTSVARIQHVVGSSIPPLIWLFPGQGAQYGGMGSGLHEHDRAFHAAYDEALDAVSVAAEFDLRGHIFGNQDAALRDTSVTQPATFCLEYALAQAWRARGAAPVAMIGHSVGEFAAAVIAGVMTLADAGRLVARRGAMMQAMPRGSMLSVRMSRESLLPRLPDDVSLAAENGPMACVVAGPAGSIAHFKAALEAGGVVARELQTSHAFHSAMMDPVVAPFLDEVRKIGLSAPAIPIVSTLTGTLLRAEEAVDAGYWSRHLREPVRFSAAVREGMSRHAAAFLEVGPRGTLATLVRQHRPAGGATPVAIASLGDTPESEVLRMAVAQGELWSLGIELPAPVASPVHGRHRVCLPTYPFEKKRFWLSAGTPALVLKGDGDAMPEAARAGSAPHQSTPVDRRASEPSAPAGAQARLTLVVPPSIASSNMTATNLPNRLPELIAKLQRLLEDIAGVDMAGVSPSARFVELGLDSLTLTQAAQQMKRAFGVNIKFRQLLEELSTLDALARFLDASLPAATPVAAPPAAEGSRGAIAPGAASQGLVSQLPAMPRPVPAAGSTGGREALLRQVIEQQMQLMAQQLALLGGAEIPGTAGAPEAGLAARIVPGPAASAASLPAPVAPASAGGSDGVGPGEATRTSYDVKKAFGAIARIHTKASELTARQRARLDAFMRRYVDKTRASKTYTETHRPHTADPRVVNGFRPMTKEITYQIVVERSKGSRVWDIDGNEYVDVLSGFGMNLFGWRPDFINEALHAQLDKGYEIGPQHALTGEVSKLVCELTGFDRVGLCNTGSEAVMAAMRIARTVTGRDTIALFTGSYHGTFDEVVVRAGRNHSGISAAPGIMPSMFHDVRVLDYGTPESLEFIRANAGDLAAVLVEPVQSRRPEFQPRDFLREVRAITEASGSCLIFDEVITGFRSHLGGIQSLFGIRSDLATYGKVIGGGLPIGAVAGKREFMDALDGGSWKYGDDSIPTVGVTYFAGTFVRHPLALAAAKASLEHLKRAGPDLQMQLNSTTTAMAEELNAYCRELGAPIEIRHFASLWRVGWLEDHPLQDLLFAMMRNRGVHILDNFPCFMTTAHTAQDIALVKTAFRESVAELQEAELIPRKAAPVIAFDASSPPVPGARLGRDRDGKPAWFIPDPNASGKYLKVVGTAP